MVTPIAELVRGHSSGARIRGAIAAGVIPLGDYDVVIVVHHDRVRVVPLRWRHGGGGVVDDGEGRAAVSAAGGRGRDFLEGMLLVLWEGLMGMGGGVRGRSFVGGWRARRSPLDEWREAAEGGLDAEAVAERVFVEGQEGRETGAD